MLKLASACLFASSVVWAGPIGALTVTSNELIAQGGEVRIYFAGETAGFDSVLNLIAPPGFGGNPFFHNHTTPIGTSLSLGTYAAGTVLRFRMDVLSTGLSFFTGPASGNPDNLIHVAHTQWASDATIPVNGVLVGFEDILGGGDLDYDDNTFVFTNVLSADPIPEPVSIVLVGVGLAGLIWRKK